MFCFTEGGGKTDTMVFMSGDDSISIGSTRCTVDPQPRIIVNSRAAEGEVVESIAHTTLIFDKSSFGGGHLSLSFSIAPTTVRAMT